MATNPRWAKRTLRNKYRARFRAMNAPCAICGKPIDYEAPSNAKFPLSFVIDEIIPISKATKYGYDSPRQAAEDFSNLQPAHWYCNAIKGNKMNFSIKEPRYKKLINLSDGEW